MDEQTFQESLKRVRSSATRDDLAATTQKSLKSLLRQPADQELLQSLLAQADTLTRNLPDNRGGQSPEVRQAAVRCVLLLETAQKGRPLKKNRRFLILLGTAAAVGAFYIFLLM
jgi:hypothetical protein